MTAELWSREGFVGDAVRLRRPNHGPGFLRAEGSHVPRRLNVADVVIGADNASEPSELLADTVTGVRLSVAKHNTSTTYVVRNVECDEIHFIQDGVVRFRTSLGTLTAVAGDFVCIPRSVTYQIVVESGPILSVIVECPSKLRFATKRPDLLDLDRDVRRADFEVADNRGGEVLLILKAGEETTRFLLSHDPLAASERLSGVEPVWKVHLSKIHRSRNSPPVQFLETDGNNELFYTLSSHTPSQRPPVHLNADYDETIYYFSGPGAWGAVTEPGTLTYVPKGVAHRGPSEDVPEGYLAWMLETRGTLRWRAAALDVSGIMETDMYGLHKTAALNQVT